MFNKTPSAGPNSAWGEFLSAMADVLGLGNNYLGAPGVTPPMADILAAVKKLADRGMDRWQPIETAPKDGTAVLVASDDGVVSAMYSPRIGEWVSVSIRPLPSFIEPPITHWMPLPEPPNV